MGAGTTRQVCITCSWTRVHYRRSKKKVHESGTAVKVSHQRTPPLVYFEVVYKSIGVAGRRQGRVKNSFFPPAVSYTRKVRCVWSFGPKCRATCTKQSKRAWPHCMRANLREPYVHTSAQIPGNPQAYHSTTRAQVPGMFVCVQKTREVCFVTTASEEKIGAAQRAYSEYYLSTPSLCTETAVTHREKHRSPSTSSSSHSPGS